MNLTVSSCPCFLWDAPPGDTVPNTPDVFTEFVNRDIAKWLDLAKRTGINLSP
jgi:hypothetical protein